MTYTHCRGCGMRLAFEPDRLDGLCTYGKASSDAYCFTAAKSWAVAHGLSIDFGQQFTRPEVATAAVWQVAIDEWLSTR